MDYNKINTLLTDKRLSIPLLADKIGMTKRGLYASIENKTLTISTLEKISEALEVSVTVFFGEDQASINQKVADLEKTITENEKKLADRQSVINVVLYSLKQINVKYQRLNLVEENLKTDGYEDIQFFIEDTIGSLQLILGLITELKLYPVDLMPKSKNDDLIEAQEIRILSSDLTPPGNKLDKIKLQKNRTSKQ